MISSEAKVRFADKIVNLTGKTIYVYEYYNGDIIILGPSRVSEIGKAKTAESRVYYLFLPNDLEKARELGLDPKTVATVRDRDIGRSGVEITYLCWVPERETKVVLIGNCHKIFKET